MGCFLEKGSEKGEPNGLFRKRFALFTLLNTCLPSTHSLLLIHPPMAITSHKLVERRPDQPASQLETLGFEIKARRQRRLSASLPTAAAAGGTAGVHQPAGKA